VRRDPALLEEDAMPAHRVLHVEVAVDLGDRGEVFRHGVLDERAHLFAEREVLLAERHVHRAGLLLNRGSAI
jgi:hypothetical protein